MIPDGRGRHVVGTIRGGEPCMECRGTGWVSEPLAGGRTLHDVCDFCLGSGFKTMKIMEDYNGETGRESLSPGE